ncbi:MAG: hypothetical protein JKY34_15915 [Kordiimonadaceae bacterium]|nr:hypothetical protein [Kordiimonadaceae bacterium]
MLQITQGVLSGTIALGAISDGVEAPPASGAAVWAIVPLGFWRDYALWRCSVRSLVL